MSPYDPIKSCFLPYFPETFSTIGLPYNKTFLFFYLYLSFWTFQIFFSIRLLLFLQNVFLSLFHPPQSLWRYSKIIYHPLVSPWESIILNADLTSPFGCLHLNSFSILHPWKFFFLSSPLSSQSANLIGPISKIVQESNYHILLYIMHTSMPIYWGEK